MAGLGRIPQGVPGVHGVSCSILISLENSQELNSNTGSYQTLCALASGGMGRVDLAVRKEGSFERLFAVKRLKAEFATDPEVRGMFLDEARIAGLVRHPNVVSVMDIGEDESGPFLVMQYVEGITVAALISEKSAQPIPMEVALKIVIHAAEGLHAAHELRGADGTPLQLVHRDVSPQNIMVGFDGVSLVTDFGIAKAMGRTSRTSTGVLKGKLGYLAPEQLRFEEPDRRADLFALGVVLFELLTARRLYKSRDGTDGPRRILSEPPPDLADYRDDAEPELVELLFELLAKRREDRPPDAKIVSRRLEAILASVVASGDSVDVAEFLTRHFAAQRAEMQAHIASVRSARANAVRLGDLASASNASAITLRRPRWPKRTLLALGALLAGGALAGFAFSRLRPLPASAGPEASAVRSDLPMPSAAALSQELRAIPTSERATPPVVAAPSPPAEASGVPATQAATSKSVPERAKATAPTRPAAQPRSAPKPKGVPVWEDY